uniref:Putative ATPase domain containing protein n=1 Tax=viral metagenome TaxID=1070528 RepID=A0A6M3LDG1_9ZZZZ
MALELTQALIEQWVSLTKGQFNVKDIWSEVDIRTTEGKKHLRTILTRLEEKGIVKQTDRGFGNYRVVDNSAPKIDWQSANSENIVPIKWPFGIEKYASIYPKNVVIIAGAKQEGKTTFLYNFIKMNMHNFKVDLFNSETGAEQMKDRFTDLGIPMDANFDVYERYDNFADVIQPNRISVIDYLDFNSEFYLAGAEIDAIFRKLTTGIAVIGMQIPPPTVTFFKGVKKVVDRDYAYGGGSTAKRAFIYISMSSRRLKIKHAKKPAQKNMNPENITWSYQYDSNGQFANIERYYGEQQEDNF